MTNPTHLTSSQASQATTRKRRWWLYILVGFGCLLLLGITLVALAVGYYKSMVRTYAQDTAQTLPQVDSSPAAKQQFARKWQDFRTSLENPAVPLQWLELSADELNTFLSNFPGVTDHVVLAIENDKLKAQFSIPLDKSGKGPLKGKYLNGVADLDVQLVDGFPKANIKAVKINGKPAPGWLVNRLRNENLLKYMERDPQALGFLQAVDKIEVREGAVILRPYVKQ